MKSDLGKAHRTCAYFIIIRVYPHKAVRWDQLLRVIAQKINTYGNLHLTWDTKTFVDMSRSSRICNMLTTFSKKRPVSFPRPYRHHLGCNEKYRN